MEAVAHSQKMENPSTHDGISSRALYYNPDRWKKVSVDHHSVGPMGIVSLPVDDPRVEAFRVNGSLVRLLNRPGVLKHGTLLLQRFVEQGCRGAVVVSRTYAHGDIFLAATVLDMLKERFPKNEIIFHTTDMMEPMVRYHPDVTIITCDARLKEVLRTAGVYLNLDDIPERFEEHNPGAGLNRIEIFGDYLGMTPESLCPSYYIAESEITAAGKYLDRFTRPFVGISPSTMRKEKSWRPDRWRELASEIVARSHGTVFVFDAKDVLGIKHPHILPMIGKGLRVAGAMAWHMDVMLTQDSLWSHWSAALNVPQILLASCTDGALLAKGYPHVTVIQRNWDCVPCWYGFQKDGCLYGNYPQCLNDVSVDEVLAKVMEELGDG